MTESTDDYDENAYRVFELLAQDKGLTHAKQVFLFWLMDGRAGSFRYSIDDIRRYAERFSGTPKRYTQRNPY